MQMYAFIYSHWIYDLTKVLAVNMDIKNTTNP